MQIDELVERIERELSIKKPSDSQLDEISSAIESESGFKPAVYHDSYSLGSSSYSRVSDYLAQFESDRQDTSNQVPLKWLNVFQISEMGGVLGFTYLGDHSMGRRSDLFGSMARMVDIHESIHTPDEYETRVLTDWILEKPSVKYKK